MPGRLLRSEVPEADVPRNFQGAVSQISGAFATKNKTRPSHFLDSGIVHNFFTSP